MLDLFAPLREFTFLSICVRLVLAIVCGGIIGAERELKRRPTGFRTHILVCLGAAMTTLTSQYLYLVMGYFTDVGRLGAQVIAGIGFMGAGAIIVTKRNRVKGLTTAAGLWSVAIVGLCLGAGFFEAALVCTVLMLLAEVVFSRLEYRLLRRAPEVNLYIEYTQRQTLDQILKLFRDQRVKVLHLDITCTSPKRTGYRSAIFNVRLSKGVSLETLSQHITNHENVHFVDEI